MTEPVSIRRVRRLDTRIEQRDWKWARENGIAIAAFWQEALLQKPKMFNGRVLLVGRYDEEDDRSTATYFETDFASFLAWSRRGFPDKGVANGFALAALRASDGAYICGVMGEHTANAGKIYFPGGTPDLNDIRADGAVDFMASVTRELEEETGLKPQDVTIYDGWIVVRQWPLVAYLKLMDIPMPAAEAVDILNANLARQREPELAGFCIVRNAGDAGNTNIPGYLQAFFKEAFRAPV